MATEHDLLAALVKRGWLTDAQAAECKEMHQMLASMGKKEPLEAVLLEKGYVKKEQIDEVRKALSHKPELVPGFVEEGVLGHGRFGSVYKATDTALGRLVAIKIVKPKLLRTPEDADRLLSEARKGAHVRHPGLADMLECGREKEKNHLFFVTEYVDGMTLRDTVLTTGPIGEKRAMQMAAEIANALGALHAQKLIHRSLTPGNVIITKDGHAKLTDFGLTPTVEVSKELNDRGHAYGTAGWMAPEQIIGLDDLDGRADLYGLGAVLYFALTGQPLFVGGGEKETIERQLQDVPPDPRTYVPTLSNSACQIVMKLLDRDRNRRYDTTADVLKDVEAILNPQAAMARAKIEGAQKGKLMTFIGAGAGLAAFAAVAFLFFRGGPAERPIPAPPIAKKDPAPPSPTPVDPKPNPTPSPVVDEDAAPKALFADADRALTENRYEDAQRLFAQLLKSDSKFAKERKDEIDQKLDLCKAKLAEVNTPKPPPGVETAEEFKRIQKLMDAAQWKDALAALGPLSEKIKGDDVAGQTLRAMREKCDLEIQAGQGWEKIQSALKERRWSEISDLARDFKQKFENSQTFAGVATDLEAAKLKAGRESIATAAINEVKEKFKALQFDDAMKAYGALKDEHGETESYKAAEPELKALADGVNTEKKSKMEESAKKALEEANKLYDAKKYSEADAAFEKFLEEFKDTDAAKGAEASIKEKREAMSKKLAGDKEAAARKDYSKVKGLFDKKSYDDAVPALKAFQEKHGDTEFAKSKKKEMDELMDKGEAALKRAKRSLIDDFEEDASSWEAKGVRSDAAKIESVETAKVGSKAMSVKLPSHDENPRDGRWPRAQKHIADELSEDITHFTFWAKAIDKPVKVTFEVHTGERDSECIFAVDKAVGVEWTQVTVAVTELKFVWSARRRANPPKLDPSRITEVGFGMRDPGKGIEFLIDQVRVEEKK
jgi:serine/threonine-protein kinase